MSSKSIDLQVGDQILHFGSAKEFEFAVDGRTSLPYAKIAALGEISDEALLREVGGIRQLEQRFVDVLERSLGETGAIGVLLKELDLTVISQDYAWRGIILALVGFDSTYDDYKRIALVKYMQYLASRQEIVKATFSNRQRGRKQSTPGARPPGSAPFDPRRPETLIFDLTPFVASDAKAGKYLRLPKGETVEIPLTDNNAISLLLAKHQFSIVSGEKFCFVDDKDHYSVLRRGKNIVGRDASSDVVIDSNYRAVSRRHLIVETEGDSLVRLTDISSLGTFVPPDYLDQTGL